MLFRLLYILRFMHRKYCIFGVPPCQEGAGTYVIFEEPFNLGMDSINQ